MAKKTKKKPDHIMVFGKKIKITYSPLADEEQAYGKFVSPSDIVIDHGLSGDALRETILHEAVHAAFHISGLQEVVTEGQQEAICLAIEYGLGRYFCL